MHYKLFFLFLLLINFNSFNTSGQTFLKTDGQKIVNAKNENILLRGMGLGGWMLQEGYMLQIHKDATQHAIKARIKDLIGAEACDKFYQLWLQNNTTKADIDAMAKWGFNSIRLPMHYNLYTLSVENEPIKGQNTWLSKGFEMTDSLVSWCKANKMYLILDLHAAPGGQGRDVNISDADTLKPNVWQSDLNKQKTIALWRKLAEKYANEPIIGAYDLLNEPNWTFENKQVNGQEDKMNTPIWDFFKEITKAIREVDTAHIVIVEGNGWGGNYNGFPTVWDKNMVFSFHKYWNTNTQGDIKHFLDLRAKHNIPIWLGESGENSNKWFKECIALAEENNIGWAWWPLKKIGSNVCPLTIKAPEGYNKLVDYWNKGGEKPDKEMATKVLMQVAENLKFKNNAINIDIIDAFFRQQKDLANKPYKTNTIPGRIFGSDYDLGTYKAAYFDTENEHVGNQKRGNIGYACRNDGVDIEQCSDLKAETNGFNIMAIEDGEWLSYSFDATKDGVYKIDARLFPAKLEGLVKVNIDQEKTIETKVLASGSQPEWVNVKMGEMRLKKGKHVLKITFEKGGFKYNYINFSLKK